MVDILEKDITPIESIYCSPMTRCIETAIAFQKAILDKRKIFVKIKAKGQAFVSDTPNAKNYELLYQRLIELLKKL